MQKVLDLRGGVIILRKFAKWEGIGCKGWSWFTVEKYNIIYKMKDVFINKIKQICVKEEKKIIL